MNVRGRHLAAAVALAACALMPVAGSPAGATLPLTPTRAALPTVLANGRTVVLSNERTFTTWSYAVERAPIRIQPSSSSRVIAHTRLETEDGYPEVYLLLARTTDARGRAWVRLRIPGRPNGRTGWVARDTLEEFHVTRWMIEIRLSARRLRAYYNGKLRISAPVGVGKPNSPTPTGHFWIRERIKVLSRADPYWPWALGTSAYSALSEWPGGGVVGVHGDLGAPRLIPGAVSHGCVRLRDADIGRLAPRVQIGTPVLIIR